jgi:hypothetical protein
MRVPPTQQLYEQLRNRCAGEQELQGTPSSFPQLQIIQAGAQPGWGEFPLMENWI